MGSLLLPLGPDTHTAFCVPCKSGVSVSPSPVEVLQSNPASLQSWLSKNSSSHCWTSRLGSLTWGSEPSLQWVDFCGTSVLQFVSHPPSGYGIWFYCDCAPPTLSLWLLLCLWRWVIFFGEFQCVPVDDCSAVSCDSGVARGSEHVSFYSAILNQSPVASFFTLIISVKTLSLYTVTFWSNGSWDFSIWIFWLETAQRIRATVF